MLKVCVGKIKWKNERERDLIKNMKQIKNYAELYRRDFSLGKM